MTTLRADINAGNTCDRQAVVEEAGESLLELEEGMFPRTTWSSCARSRPGSRKSLLRVYHIQREQFLPSAKAMIYC